jgi:hypothetical protein
MLACCAFAVFLLNQLLMPFAILRERLWGKAPPRENAAVLWRPAPAVPAPRARRLAWRPALIAILALETLAAAGSVAAATIAARRLAPVAESPFLIALHASICRAVGRPLS